MIGILAYGSLITDTGREILDLKDHYIQPVATPFPVEYARRSKTHANAPTLVSVPEGNGDPVQAAVIVLKDGTPLQKALDMLYRREIHRVGDLQSNYRQPDDNGLNRVRITQLNGFAGLDTVIYTNLTANFVEILDDRYDDQQKAVFLCQAACESLNEQTFYDCQDGIHYLYAAIQSGVQTRLTNLYAQAILNIAGNNVVDLTIARTIIAKSKGL